jgi:hypothetical protein
MDQAPLYDRYDSSVPASHPTNQPVTATKLPTMVCPSQPPTQVVGRGVIGMNSGTPGGRFAKITYGLNGGTDEINDGHDWLDVRERGIGNTGIQISASIAEIRDGTSLTILLGEIITDNSNTDCRGCWGHATSATFAGHAGRHNGGLDARGSRPRFSRMYTPNINPDRVGNWARDRTAYCDGQLRGNRRCRDRGCSKDMAQAVRSDHVGGAHVAMADGSARFVSDSIDRGVWYSLISIMNGIAMQNSNRYREPIVGQW